MLTHLKRSIPDLRQHKIHLQPLTSHDYLAKQSKYSVHSEHPEVDRPDLVAPKIIPDLSSFATPVTRTLKRTYDCRFIWINSWSAMHAVVKNISRSAIAHVYVISSTQFMYSSHTRGTHRWRLTPSDHAADETSAPEFRRWRELSHANRRSSHFDNVEPLHHTIAPAASSFPW